MCFLMKVFPVKVLWHQEHFFFNDTLESQSVKFSQRFTENNPICLEKISYFQSAEETEST